MMKLSLMLLALALTAPTARADDGFYVRLTSSPLPNGDLESLVAEEQDDGTGTVYLTRVRRGVEKKETRELKPEAWKKLKARWNAKYFESTKSDAMMGCANARSWAVTWGSKRRLYCYNAKAVRLAEEFFAAASAPDKPVKPGP